MFTKNIGRSNSALSKALTQWADQKLITISDYDTLMSQLDNDFIIDGDKLIRKQTNRLVDGSLDRNFSLMVKANINDKSFGSFKSVFTPRKTTVAEQQSVDAVFMHHAGLTIETKERLRNEFIVDKGNLRRLDTATGYISESDWTPQNVIQSIQPEGYNTKATELNQRREKSQRYKMAKELALNEENDPKVVNRLWQDLEEINAPKYTPIVHDFLIQKQDMEKRSMSYVAILDMKDATQAEINKMLILQKSWNLKLNTL